MHLIIRPLNASFFNYYRFLFLGFISGCGKYEKTQTSTEKTATKHNSTEPILKSSNQDNQQRKTTSTTREKFLVRVALRAGISQIWHES